MRVVCPPRPPPNMVEIVYLNSMCGRPKRIGASSVTMYDVIAICKAKCKMSATQD